MNTVAGFAGDAGPLDSAAVELTSLVAGASADPLADPSDTAGAPVPSTVPSTVSLRSSIVGASAPAVPSSPDRAPPTTRTRLYPTSTRTASAPTRRRA